MLASKGIVTKQQKKILQAFAQIPDSERFYLSGGTALADFYLAHRKSFDLDLFTTESGLVYPFSLALENSLKVELAMKVVRRMESFVEFEIGYMGEETRVQLAYDSPFRFADPVDSDLGIKVNDYEDLVADKLLAFYGRAEPRDAIDLYFILADDDIWRLAGLAGRKDPGFDLYWLAVALGKVRDFPDEISRWPVEMVVEVDPIRLKKQFGDHARDAMRRIKEKS